jgi:hypothetical protein
VVSLGKQLGIIKGAHKMGNAQPTKSNNILAVIGLLIVILGALGALGWFVFKDQSRTTLRNSMGNAIHTKKGASMIPPNLDKLSVKGIPPTGAQTNPQPQPDAKKPAGK